MKIKYTCGIFVFKYLLFWCLVNDGACMLWDCEWFISSDILYAKLSIDTTPVCKFCHKCYRQEKVTPIHWMKTGFNSIDKIEWNKVLVKSSAKA